MSEIVLEGVTKTFADGYEAVTVLSADCVGINQLGSQFLPSEMVQLMNDIFSGFDWLVDVHGLVRIKTFGDNYMVVGGAPTPRPDHASGVAEMALEMLRITHRFNTRNGVDFHIRIGISTGAVMAGIIGRKNFFYHMWGPAVDTATQMESTGAPDTIQVSASTYQLLKDHYDFEERAAMEIKGQGWATPHSLIGRIKPAKKA